MDKIALLFPGQGSQYVGMGKTLYDEYNIVKETFEEANDTLGYDIQKICFQGSNLELNRTDNMLLSILLVSVAVYRVYMKEVGIEPAFLAGHSLGEYSALTCASSIRFSDALKIVRYRSELAQRIVEAGNSGMTVVNEITKDILEEQCSLISKKDNNVSIACYNSLNQFVIAGHKAAVLEAEDKIIELGGQITPLLTSPPFHSMLLNDVAKEFKAYISNFDIKTPQWPVVFNVTAKPSIENEIIKENLINQLTKPVLWRPIIKFLYEQDVNKIIEIGPGAVLSNLIELNKIDIPVISFGQKDDRDCILKTLTKSDNRKIDNTIIKPTVVTRSMAIAVCTRNTNWDDEEYCKFVEEPYEEIQKMQDELDASGEQPTKEQMLAALNMLKSVFKTKRTPMQERIDRFNQIFEETSTKDIFVDFDMTE